MNDGESLLLRNVTTILEYIQLPPIGSSHLREVEKKMRHSNHRIEVGESNRYSTIYLYDERQVSQLIRYRSVASNGLKKKHRVYYKSNNFFVTNVASYSSMFVSLICCTILHLSGELSLSKQ